MKPVLALLLMISAPVYSQESPPTPPFLEGSLDQAARLAGGTGPAVDPAVDEIVDILKARMEAWGDGLPGASGAGLVDRSSEAYRAAKDRSREEGLPKALSGRVSEALVDRAALHRNRGVRAADLALEAAIRRYPQTAHLENLVAQYQDLAAGQRPAAGMALAPMTRERRSGDGTLAIQADITTVEVEIAAVDSGLARRRAITSARKALTRYAWAREAASAVRELESLVGPLIEVVRIRLETGTASQSELLRLEVLRTDLETLRRNLGDEATRAAADLAAVLDLPGGTSLGSPRGAALPDDIPEVDALVRRALSRRHELRRLRLKIQKLDHVIDLQKTRALPDLATGMSDLRDPLASDGEVAFPDRPLAPTDIFVGGREAWLEELRELQKGLTEQRRDLEAHVRAEVETARAGLTLHRRSWRAHSGRMLEKSHQRVELERAGYQQGRRSFQDVVNAEEEYIRHRLKGLDALRDARLAWADLRDAAMLVDSTGGPSVSPDHPGG